MAQVTPVLLVLSLLLYDCSTISEGVPQVLLVDGFGLESEGLGREASSVALHLPQRSSAATRWGMV